MAFLRVCALLLLFSLPLSAQLIIEEVSEDSSENRTVTLVSDQSSDMGKKKEWGAAFLSLAMPGTGQFYLGQKEKGAAYISAEALLIFGTIFSEATSRRMYRGSMEYARIHGNTDSDLAWDDNYWNEIGRHDSYEIYYRDNLEKFREFDESEDFWEWESSKARDSYNDQRSTASDWHSASYVFIGGLVVNHLVSFIDARISARRYNNNLLSTLNVHPYYSFHDGTGGLVVTGAF